jgi:RNA polymerase sigma-70 factor (ECF subfamily)
MSREDDYHLAERLVSGDPSAFRDFVEAYKRKVYGLAYEMTRNHADAEDVSQVAFMKVHRSIDTIQPGRGLAAWLYQIVYRTALDHIRGRSFFPKEAVSSPSKAALYGEPADPSAGPDKEVETACLWRRIDEALAKISTRERAVFVLRHYQGLRVKEIAEALGISLGSAKSYLFRALRKLQKELAETEMCPDEGDRS